MNVSTEPTAHIIDDDPAVRDSLIWLLESESISTRDFDSSTEFLRQYDPCWHGCIVLDVRMPGMNGLDLQERLISLNNTMPVIMVTGHADVPMAIRAMKAGALDFIEKPFSDEEILNSIKYALQEEDQASRARIDNTEIYERFQKLTPREREIMDLVVNGKANKVIAADLDVSTKTVEVHRSRIMYKMKARSISELVRQAIYMEKNRVV